MTTILAKLYDDSDSLIGELPDFSDVSVQDQLSSEGAWTMKYDRRGRNADLLFQESNIGVKFYIDGDYVWEGMIEEDNYDQVSDSSPVTLAGRSWAGMFEFAKVYPKAGLGTTTAAEYPFTTATPGNIFITLLNAAQARGVLSGFTVSFTATHDSDGQEWTTPLTITYKAGVSLLDIIKNFGQSGQADWRMVGKRLDMYNPKTVLGSQSGVTFRRGRDITSAPRSRSRRKLGNVYLVQGDNDVTVERTDASAISAIGRREQFLSQGGITDVGTLAVVGDLELSVYSRDRISKTHNLVFSSEPEVYAAQPKPWKDYQCGQYVDTDLTGTTENYRLIAMTIGMGTDGYVTGEVTLNDIFAEREILLSEALTLLSGGSAAGGTSTTTTTATADKTIPGVPTLLTGDSEIFLWAEGNKYAQVTLTWTAPELNTDGSPLVDFQDYQVQWWYTASPVDVHTAFTSENFINISFLDPGASFSYQVRTRDSNSHVSSWSDTHTFTLADDNQPPPIPSTPVVEPYLGILRATWDGLGNSGEEMPPDFKNVEVWYSEVNDFTPGDPGSIRTDTLASGATADISGLTYGTTYYVKFLSVDLVGNRSDASEQDSGVPKQVVQTDIGNNVIDFSNIRFKDIGNLVPDGSFELDTTAALVAEAGVAFAVVDNPDGTTVVPSPHCLRMSASPDTEYFSLVSGVRVSYGEKYALILSWRQEGFVSGDVVQLQFLWTLADGTTSITVTNTSFQSTSNTSGWRLREAIMYEVPENAIALDLLIGSQITTSTAFLYFDEMEVRKQTGTALIEDAAISRAKIALLAVGDAQIENMSAGKITVGTLNADITVSARIKTADTGARVELNSGGIQVFNSSNQQTGLFDSSNGSISITGSIKSGSTGTRIEINPAGLPTIRFFSGAGTEFGYVNGFTQSGTDVGVGFNSSNFTSGTTQVGARMVAFPSQASMEIIDNSQATFGGHISASPDGVYAVYSKGSVSGGYVNLNDTEGKFGIKEGSTTENTWYATSAAMRHYGKWENNASIASNQGLFMGYLPVSSGFAALDLTYGPTMISTMHPVACLGSGTFDNTTGTNTASPIWGISAGTSSTTGFSVGWDKGIAVFINWWAFRI